MEPGSIHSLRSFMVEHLFRHVDLPDEHIHFLPGNLPREAMPQACLAYEEEIKAAGGIDFQILGIGKTGHIGFNEPGSRADSRTRLITLDRVTRLDAATDFFWPEICSRRSCYHGNRNHHGGQRNLPAGHR